jgi:hypothetical protein
MARFHTSARAFESAFPGEVSRLLPNAPALYFFFIFLNGFPFYAFTDE